MMTQGKTPTCNLVNGRPAQTNWAKESLGNSVDEFEYLRLSCKGSSQSGYQAGKFDGEGKWAWSARRRLIQKYAPDLTVRS